MKIVTLNLNGIRSAVSKGLIDWLIETKADFYCFQELKVNDLDFLKELVNIPGYQWHASFADKKGYSGVGILSTVQPKEVLLTCGNVDFDSEGRCLAFDSGHFLLLNYYFPSGTMGETRQKVKDSFLAFLDNYLVDLQKKWKHIILAGDFNIAHKEIDIHNPKGLKNTSGFLPHERAWLDTLVNSGWSDTLRLVSHEPDQYTWWSYRAGAKSKNKGWRLDYFFVTESLSALVKNQIIHKNQNFSDHCPVEINININS